jgi:catechol 2,3-dioxygenase-like lactoylglutathione lyase family enzyme
MEVFSLEHVGLLARDPETLKNWYVRTLGATVAFASNTTPPAFLVRLPGGVMLEIGAAAKFENDASDNTTLGFRHLALRVENIESARVMLEKNGVRFTETIKPAGGGGRVLYFPDGEGNLLHFVERSGEGKAFEPIGIGC